MAIPPMSPPTRAHNHHAAPTHSPSHTQRPHVRRSSASLTFGAHSSHHRTSFSNLEGTNLPTRSYSFSRSSISSPPIMVDRTPCPKDGDAFSYDPKHLSEWFIHDDLWCQLPEKLRIRLAAVQHAGAAVLTGFERLEQLSHNARSDGAEVAQVHTPRSTAIDENSDIDAGKKQPRTDRIDSFNSDDLPNGSADNGLGLNFDVPAVHVNDPDKKTVAPGTESRMSPLPSPVASLPANPLDTAPALLSTHYAALERSSSPPTANSSPALASITTMPDIPSNRRSRREDTPSVRSRHPSTDGRSRHHFRTHSAYSQPPTPRDPHTSRYVSELSHLRCVSIVRLRHKARGVDLELCDMRRAEPSQQQPAPTAAPPLKDFESWWVRKREFIAKLDGEAAAVESKQLVLDAAEAERMQLGEAAIEDAFQRKKGLGRGSAEVSPMATPEVGA